MAADHTTTLTPVRIDHDIVVNHPSIQASFLKKNLNSIVSLISFCFEIT